MTVLSKLIDPSGELTKIINDYLAAKSATSTTANATTSTTTIASAAPESQSAATTAAAPNGEQVKSAVDNVTQSAESSTAATTIDAAVPATNSSSNGAAQPAAPVDSVKVVPPVAPQQNNVTVNVFLELAPDAATDQMVSISYYHDARIITRLKLYFDKTFVCLFVCSCLHRLHRLHHCYNYR